MRRIAEVLGSLLTALSSFCCTTSAPPSQGLEVRALSAGGAAASSINGATGAQPRLVFQVSARYAASVVYALDQAAAARAPDPRYRTWLFGEPPAKLPDWFEAYAGQRSAFETSRRGPDGSYDALARCSHGADALTDVLACAKLLLSPSQLALARTALQETDVLLRARWATLEPVLQRWQQELQAITSGPKGTELAELLARSAQLPNDQPLRFEVVLVAKPRGSEARAHQAGGHLVMEVRDDREPIQHADVLFHELAHLAAHHAPNRPALESAFNGRGASGMVAAQLWNEAFATAFGNGLAAERLDPSFDPGQSFYHDSAIDALGRALYRRWRAGAAVALDASLADHLLQLVESDWPRARWRMADVTRRLVVFSDDREAAAIVREGLRSASLSSYVPVPEHLNASGAGESAPRLIVATVATLQKRPDLLESLGLDLASARARVHQQGASLFASDGTQGLSMLVTAASRERLQAAAKSFCSQPLAPAPGWSSLKERAAPESAVP